MPCVLGGWAKYLFLFDFFGDFFFAMYSDGSLASHWIVYLLGAYVTLFSFFPGIATWWPPPVIFSIFDGLALLIAVAFLCLMDHVSQCHFW